MRLIPAQVRTGWNWWWGFGLLIGAPALALAVLGLRAVRTERVDRERQLLEQQAQLARVADSALSSHFAELAQQLRDQDASDETGVGAGFTPLSLDRSGQLTFIRDRVYSGESGEQSPEWPQAIERLIDQAQAAQAQQRTREAVGLYGRIREIEPRLRDWADLCAARIRSENSDQAAREMIASAHWSQAQGLSPLGLPVALVTCAYSDLPGVERSSFVPLLEKTFQGLRSGQWWFSYEQRVFYDRQLRSWLEAAGTGSRFTEDVRLRELAAIERIVRNSPPVRRDVVTHVFDRAEDWAWLIIWAPQDRGSESRLGLAISETELTELFDEVLKPLLVGMPARVAIRDDKGGTLWGEFADARHVEPLRVVPEWELAFSGSGSTVWSDQKRLLWYGFILLLVVMLMAGVGMTVWVVRQEAELARMQNEFISGVTHEFKSPITSIRLLLERLAGGKLQSAEAAGEYHSAIDHEMDRLERHVDRLLEAQKIQEERREYHFAPTLLIDVVRSAIDDLEPQARARGITLESRFDGKNPGVSLDRPALTDALENLLDNAIKYSTSGTRVSVVVRATDSQVCVDVCDEGIGISGDDLPRIFDKFYRGRRGDQHSARGTGLGLALVKATIEAHGGTIEVVSEPGQGSTFSIRLPMDGAAERDSQR